MWHILGQYNALEDTGTLWLQWKRMPPVIAVALWSSWEKLGRELQLEGHIESEVDEEGNMRVRLPGGVVVQVSKDWTDEFFDQLLIALEGMEQKRSEGLKGYYTSLINLMHRN